MQFYNSNGIIVTDTAFITPNGDQYPIRNISSVKVRRNDAPNGNKLALAAVALWVLWLLKASPPEGEAAICAFLAMVLVFTYLYFGRRYVLLIGSGGMDQTSLSFPLRQENYNTLLEIAAAINASIANLQKTYRTLADVEKNPA